MERTDQYSAVDRLLHRLAFATSSVQVELGDLESRLFKDALTGVVVRRPVFVTALPRAGTTLLLQLVAALPDFASHSYRDMPFVLTPLLWDSLSRRFRQDVAASERAHGDGMLVSVDSAEAFEEMVWKALWPERYSTDRLQPWTSAGSVDAVSAFLEHLRKVVALRRPDPRVVPRYLSKNNANICRIGVLREVCPDAVIVVPVRDPAQHAASLLHQHRRFLDLHARDRFARDYMAGIGHFDFGANLRPIDFGGWLAAPQHADRTSIGFWLEYWVAAYTDLLTRRSAGVQFLPYEGLCADSRKGMRRLAEVLELETPAALLAQSETIRAPRAHDVDLSAVAPELRTQAEELYRSIVNVSILGEDGR